MHRAELDWAWLQTSREGLVGAKDKLLKGWGEERSRAWEPGRSSSVNIPVSQTQAGITRNEHATNYGVPEVTYSQTMA